MPLKDGFFNEVPMANGLTKVGMSMESILDAAADYDVIGVSSIFTPQTSTCLELVAQLRAAFPDKIILAGGVNARNMTARFFSAGVDLIALSEAEETIVLIARALQGNGDVTSISGLALRTEDGREHHNVLSRVIRDLDELPLPAWDLLPIEQYWKISRPHGGNFKPGQTVRYASLQTSRGCPFRCDYCHISLEGKDSPSGPIGAFRVKSVDRVLQEFKILKDLGVEYIFIEDDSLFAKKRRAIEIFQLVRDMGLKLLDVNGINLIHMHAGHADGLGIDTELIGVLADAGFTTLTLPFESASQRIIDKYASSKWNVATTDTASLIRAFNYAGIRVSGNYMIGYPDETEQEIAQTIAMARKHIEQGLDYALFFTVVPFPGSALFETAVREGYISANFDPDEMRLDEVYNEKSSDGRRST